MRYKSVIDGHRLIQDDRTFLVTIKILIRKVFHAPKVSRSPCPDSIVTHPSTPIQLIDEVRLNALARTNSRKTLLHVHATKLG